MAKAAKPNEDQKMVPNAEPVGGDQVNTKSTDTPQESVTEGGAGNPAGPAGGATGVADTDFPQGKSLIELNKEELAAGTHPYPRLGAAAVQFHERYGHANVAIVRITAKDEGLRRGGMRHSGTRDHQPHFFRPEQMEQLLGERGLIVEFLPSQD